MKNSEAKETLTNQTLFSNQEPIFEEPPTLSPDPKTLAGQVVPPKAKNPALTFVLGFFGMMLIMLGVVLVFAQAKQSTQKLQGTAAEQTKNIAVQTEVQKRLTELKAELKEADPIQMELPFPVVNEQIYLEAPERR